MPNTLKNDAMATLEYAARKLDNFLAATKGDDSRCGVFNNQFLEEFSPEQLRAIRIYVETWIQTPLSYAIKSAKGDRSYDTESGIAEYAKSWI